ncbi:hypothetical protein [Mesorhizobium sp.]|uniref:hypothetical protein n=1 Tax=Mesorhizobium sp. TaxID=1871066 RepID=UPI001207E504|nr:hypothetical protein [Mesorhizobium sp.]TIL42790.1 MAG: hypothetical protein E5Y86_25655 [Mesorhizobium sp.]
MMLAAMPRTQSSARYRGALKLHRGAAFGEISITRLQPKHSTNPPVAANGTALAISYATLGVAAHLPSSAGRGGARNRADRESYALTLAHVANLRAAERHADKIGLPFTRMVSIHWEAAGVPLAGMANATGRYTDLMAKALARHGSRSAWIWTHENGDGKGGHCHLLAHVPADLVAVLTGLQRGWLRRITGQPYRARVIHSRPIGGRLGLEKGNPDLHAINLEAALSYILKGASEAAATKFNLERLEPGGRVIGKRCGTSQNIGAKARKEGVI